MTYKIQKSGRKSLHQMLRTELRSGLSEIYKNRMKGIYLFGSYARGEEERESDLDILIVLDGVKDYMDEIERTGHLISGLSLKYAISLSRVFLPEEEWRNGQTVFLRNVREEAIPA